MIIDGFDLKDITGLKTRSPSRSAAKVKQIIQGAPGAWRRHRLGHDAPEPMLINVAGWVYGSTLSQMQSRLDELKFRVRPDAELVVTWSDVSGREFLGYRESLQIQEIAPDWLTEGVGFQLRILCPMPHGRDTSLQNDTNSGALPRVITPTVGTAPMPVVITITGNSGNLVNPVLHYRDGSDTDIYTLAYSGTLGASDTLVIDTEAMTAVLNGSTNKAGSMSGTYFDVNPGDGTPYAGSPTYPDIQLTGTGTADLYKVEWRRRYW
jgi:hypothetical protein